MTEDSFWRLREMAREICDHGSTGERAMLAALLALLKPDPSASRAREIAELERMLGRD